VKETDDGTKVGVSDVGSIPTTSTKTWADKPERLGQKLDKRPDWYYTPNEWSRSIGWGTVPDERNSELRKEHGGDMVSTGRIEIVQEDSDTQYKRQR
tara:strand:+ start:599 stop:889 length:291 start_codon:yes stop_codon:yes gene_type:complete